MNSASKKYDCGQNLTQYLSAACTLAKQI